jgi:hypothetical protein
MSLFKKDMIFVAVLLFLTLAVAGICHAVTKAEGNLVVVSIDGETYETYSLEKDQTITVQTSYGTNTFTISDGKVFMEDADCPDKICTGHSAITNANETIICLPHRFVIEIKGGVEEESSGVEIDGVAN